MRGITCVNWNDMSIVIEVFLPLVLGALLSLVIVLLIGVPLWIKPASRFYINPVPFFVHFKATATRLRRVVFSVLLIWALVDSFLSLYDGWFNSSTTAAPLWGRIAISIVMYFMSLCLNLLFMGIVALGWDWSARRCKNREKQK